jgi:hypothetical protein
MKFISMSTRWRVILGSIAAMLVVSLAPGIAFGELSREEERRASRSLSEGDALQAGGRCEEAIRLWRATFRWTGHWMFPMRIALCMESLGRYREALTYLRRGRELGWNELMEEGQAELLGVIRRVEARLPALLDVTANVGDARIEVDGRSAGTLPLLEPLELTPGRHMIELSAPGYRRAERVITIGAGSRNVTFFTLMSTQPFQEHSSRGSPRRWWSPHRLWGVLLLSLGLSSAGVGAWFMAQDGQIGDGVSYDTFGAGMSVATLGAGLVAGGLAILIHPRFGGGNEE